MKAIELKESTVGAQLNRRGRLWRSVLVGSIWDLS